MFHYSGIERIQLFFDTPNLCAAFLVMTGLIFCGIFFMLWKMKFRGKVPLCILTGLLITMTWILLGNTYSRGGYIAGGAVLLLYALLLRRPVHFAAFLYYFACIAITENGVARVQAISDFSDKSILHRFWVWDGALRIIAEYWKCGIGPIPSAGRYYSLWIQPLHIQEIYNTMINDFLTIGTAYGIGACFILLAFLIFLFLSVWKIWRKKQQEWILYLAGIAAGFLICGFFSTCFTTVSLIILPALAVLVILVLCIRAYWKKDILFKKGDIILTLIVPLVICAGIMTYGSIRNRTTPYVVVHSEIQLDKNLSIQKIRILPKENSSRGELLFITPDYEQILRTMILPAVLQGYNVTAFRIPSEGYAADSLQQLFQKELAKTQKVHILAMSRVWAKSIITAVGRLSREEKSRIGSLSLTNIPSMTAVGALSETVKMLKDISEYPVFLWYTSEHKIPDIFAEQLEK